MKAWTEAGVVIVSEPSTIVWAYDFAGHRLVPAWRTLTREDGTAIELRGKAFDALAFLVEHAGELVDRRALLHALWPKRVVEDNNLNQVVVVLRRALGEEHIATVSGRGYQFVTPVWRIAVENDAGSAPREPPADRVTEPPSALAAIKKSPARGGWVARPGALALGATLIGVAVAAATLWLNPPAADEEALPLRGAALVTSVTSYAGAETTPSFSPTGNEIAFSWEGESGNRDIYVTQIGTGIPHRLTMSTAGVDENPVWSPDGQSIAFMRRYDPSRFDVVLIPARGGRERKLASGEMFWLAVDGFPMLAWTSDSRQLLFTTRRSSGPQAWSFGLHRLDIASAEVTDLGLGDGQEVYDTSPAISADGKWLAFARYRRSQRLNQLMVQPLEENLVPAGEALAVPELEPGLYHSLAWSSAADRLWFANGGRILEWEIGGRPRIVQAVAPNITLSAMAIAGQGREARAAIVTRLGNEDIWALPLNPVTHEALDRAVVRVPSSAIDYHPRFSPDGEQLAFVSDRSGSRAIWVADADGGNPRRLTTVDQLITGYPRWSPDGKHIAFHTSAPNEARVVYLVEVESGNTKRLFNACCPTGWSADGRYLYVMENNFVVRRSIANSSGESLFLGEGAVESMDGRYLLYARSAEPGYFRRLLGPPLGEEVRLVEDYRVSRGGIYPVDDGFYYMSFTPENEPRAIRFYDYERGEPRDIATAPKSVSIGLTVSPDGRELLYSAIDGPDESDIVLLEFGTEHGR